MEDLCDFYSFERVIGTEEQIFRLLVQSPDSIQWSALGLWKPGVTSGFNMWVGGAKVCGPSIVVSAISKELDWKWSSGALIPIRLASVASGGFTGYTTKPFSWFCILSKYSVELRNSFAVCRRCM